MSETILLEEMERAHVAFNDCSEQLADALNEVKAGKRRSKEQLERISELNKHCDELMRVYLTAFKSYHGQEEKEHYF